MALVQFLMNDMLGDTRGPSMVDLFDHNIGQGLSHNIFYPYTPNRSMTHGYMRPWRHLQTSDSGLLSLTNDKNQFKVNLDVQQFKPEELKVTVEDGHLIVNGKHEERSDEHGFISRQFTRRYKIPQDVDEKALVSHLSSDGVLSLHAPKIIKQDEKKTIELPITFTNEPLKISEPKTEEKPKEILETK